jgi:uncharacterized protein
MANGWGGRRHGSGRKPPGVANDNVVKLKTRRPPQPMFSDASIMAILDAMREQGQRARNRPRTADWNPYVIRPDRFGPVAAHLQKRNPKLAMDQNDALAGANMYAVNAWQAGGLLGNDAAEGLLFLGYPFLSEMAQRAEFRLFGEIMSEEMTRKFIDFRGTEDESVKEDDKDETTEREEDATAEDEMPPQFRPGAKPEDEGDSPKDDPDKKPRSDGRNKEIERKIIELRHLAEDIKLRQVFKTIAAHDAYFGIGHLFLDLKGANVDDPRDPENRMSIGNGRDEASKQKLGKGCLKGLRCIEPVWCYPTMYNAMNPLHPSWYDPEVWYVMGAEIHKTRLIPFVGRPVPDILKPAYAFGGLPMTQMAQPYVDIWLRTRESVAELIHAFSIMILQTNMGTVVQPGGAGGQAGDVVARMQLMNAMRDNQGMMILDKATEDFKNVSAPLGTLDQLQAQAQEHMYSVARIPAVKWTGIQPQGLNATSEGELRAFNDTVHGAQEHLFRVGLTTIVDIMMISLWGKRDPDIVFDFNELHEMTEKEKAETGKIKAETDQIRVDSGIVSQEEVRAVLVADPDSGYHGLDPDDTPDLLGEEQAGLIPEGAGKGLEAELGQGGGPQGGPGGGGAQGQGGGGPPFNGPPKRRKPPPFGGGGGADMAMDKAVELAELRGPYEAAQQADQMGFLDGLNGLDVIPDKDQWNAEYIPESDRIEVQRKLLGDRDDQKTRTILHEAGHRGQYRKGKACFRAFEAARLGTTDNFVALANRVHLHDFRCKGHVEDKTGEVFSESYAHWCLGMEMPEPLQAFWRKWSARGEADDSVVPFPGAADAEWNEADHPRAPDGKFGSGGGGGAKAKPKASHTGGPNATPQKPFAKLDISNMMKVSGKMGSNEGGIYKQSGTGQDFYVKKPKGAAQVQNENAAARLYQLAGANTFEYQDAGPYHVATKMENLTVNNVNKMKPSEKKQTQQDFAIHAWLANWDAVGMGGDNAGIDENGKPKVLDVGGSLFFRAQGEPKGANFGPKVNETATFMNPQMNPDAAAFYGDMTALEKVASAKRVTEIPNNAIREIAEVSGYDKSFADLLIARKNDLAAQYGLTPAGDTNPEWEALHPRGPGGKFAAKPGGEEGPGEVVKQPWPGEEVPQEISPYDSPKFANYKDFEDQANSILYNPSLYEIEELQEVAAANPEHAKQMLKSATNDKLKMYLQKGIDEADQAEMEKVFAELKGPPKIDSYSAFADAMKSLDNAGKEDELKKLFAANPQHKDQFLKDYPVSAKELGLTEGDGLKIDDYNDFWDAMHTAVENGDIAGAEALAAANPQHAEKFKKLNPAIAAEMGEKAKPKAFEPKPAGAFKSKKELIGHLLSNPEGVTMAEVLKQTGWPSVSMPAQAAAAGMKLEKKKVGGETKYFGTPMTGAEKVDLKNKAKKKIEEKGGVFKMAAGESLVGKPAPAAPPPPPAPVKLPEPPPVAPSKAKPTEAELQKAKKSVALKMDYIPGEKPISEEYKKTTQAMIDIFNENWAGKENLTDAQLTDKVNQFKHMQSAMESLVKAEKPKLEELKKQQAAKANEELKVKKAAEAQANAALLADPSFAALAGVTGGVQGAKNYIQHGKHYVDVMKKHGVDLTPVDGALINTYVGSHYETMNEQNYAHELDPAQWQYRKALQAAFEKMPKYEGDVERGIKNITAAQFAKYKVGKVIPTPAFASAGKKHKLWGKFTLKIKSKTARDISMLNSEGGGEVVFMPGTGFKVISNDGKVAVIEEV